MPSKRLSDASIVVITKANTRANVFIYSVDPNNPTGAEPAGKSNKMPLSFFRSKAVVIPTGSGQGTAFLIESYDNIADVVGAGTGVIFPSVDVSDEWIVNNNDGSENLEAYPPVGFNFQGEADNDPITINVGNTFLFKVYEFGEIRIFVI